VIGRHFSPARDILTFIHSINMTGQVDVNTKSLTGLLCEQLPGEWQKNDQSRVIACLFLKIGAQRTELFLLQKK
jgi:hypothetical protein